MIIDLTKGEAYAVADIIDTYIFQMIRDDLDIDNISWLRNILNAYDKLCDASGYVGLTDSREGKQDEST